MAFLITKSGQIYLTLKQEPDRGTHLLQVQYAKLISIAMYVCVSWLLPERLTKKMGALCDGELIARWDLQWSHHIDVGAHPLIHSERTSGTNSG